MESQALNNDKIDFQSPNQLAIRSRDWPFVERHPGEGRLELTHSLYSSYPISSLLTWTYHSTNPREPKNHSAPLRGMNGVAMARWVLNCPQCNQDITHVHVATESGLFAWSGTKPDFPDGGLSVVCPNCKTSLLYQRNQLLYRAT